MQVLIGNGSGSFSKGAAYVSPAIHPQGLATADFDHDGHLDVAVACASATGLRILYGNGGTSFTARAIAGDANLNVLGVGDFNGDGWMDVAAASTTGSTVAIYLGGGSGLVHTQTAIVGASPRGLVVADLNDDGIPDIVTANRASSTVSVLAGDRAHRGAFLAHIETAAGLGSRDAVVADFDSDGHLDLATANENAPSVTVLTNQTPLADAAFAFARSPVADAAVVSPITKIPPPADFNRDGRLDLAAAGPDNETIVVLLAGRAALSLSIPGILNEFTIADINGDGNPDIVFAIQEPDGQGGIGAYLGDGHGGFVRTAITPAPRILALAAGDMNQDGRIDLVSLGFDDAANSWVLQVNLAKANGAFAAPATTVLLTRSGFSLALGDVNRDGRLDVAVMLPGLALSEPSEMHTWSGNGSGGLTATPSAPQFQDTIAVSFELADVNRDGFLDIVAADGERMAVSLGNGTSFSEPVETAVSTDKSRLGGVSLGDLNDDGQIDAAFQSGDVMFGNGDGTFRLAAG